MYLNIKLSLTIIKNLKLGFSFLKKPQLKRQEKI